MDPASNMAYDEALLEAMPRVQRPVLRFYAWTEPAATFGYFQHYAEVEQLTALRPLIRRPTAGGIVPHDADWTYSLAFPTTHEWYALSARDSYRRLHCWVKEAFAGLNQATELAPEPFKPTLGQCFIGHEQADLLWRGRKIAGAAQRRRKDGLLIQGSIQPPLPALSRIEWEKAMLDSARRMFGIEWHPEADEPLVQQRALELRDAKYSRPDYNRRR
jgi:lipoate-protein ligase A